jgi:hypothetical protein
MNAVERFALLKDSINLLREVRSGLHSESFHGLAVLLDEVISKLEAIEREGFIDPGRIDGVLTVLGRGLATVPTILKLIDALRNL